MPVEIILPKVDMDMDTGKILKWMFQEGEFIQKGDTLLEIETGKSAMDIEAPVSGFLHHISGKTGLDIPVGTSIAWIYEENETPDSSFAPISHQLIQPVLSPTVTIEPLSKEFSKQSFSNFIKGLKTFRASPLARSKARKLGLDLSQIKGSAFRGRIISSDIDAYQATLQNASFHITSSSDIVKAVKSETISDQTSLIWSLYEELCIDPLLDLCDQLTIIAGEDHKITQSDILNLLILKAFSKTLKHYYHFSSFSHIKFQDFFIGVTTVASQGVKCNSVNQILEKSLSSLLKEISSPVLEERTIPQDFFTNKNFLAHVLSLPIFNAQSIAQSIEQNIPCLLTCGIPERKPITRNGTVIIGSVISLRLSFEMSFLEQIYGFQFLDSLKLLLNNPISLLV